MIIIISFVIFLFAVFLLSKDDFVLLRKNVTTQQVFDSAFLASAAALLISRIVFVAFHFRLSYFNPLVLFLVPYFPGLSLPGALLGGIGWFLLFNRKKFPTARLLDILLLSFLFAFASAVGIQGIVFVMLHAVVLGLVTLGVSVLSFIMSILLQREFATSQWKDGSVSLWMMTYLSIISLLYSGFLIFEKKEALFYPEPLLFVFFLLGVFITLFVQIGKREG